MGVTRGFWNVLKPVARIETLESLRGKVLAIDLSFWMIQLLSRVKGIFIRKPHVRLLFFRTIHLIVKVGASPVFVVDGEPPPLKWAVRLNRFSRISGVPLSSSIGEADCNAQPSRNNHFKCSVDECVKLLELLGMPVLRAKHEAEGLCAELQKQGLVDACVTPDSDAFLYGAEHVIKIFQVDLKDPHVESYMMKDIESFLGLHREHLVALALLAGCDYNVSGVPGIGCHSAVRLIKVVPKDEVLGRLEDWGAGRFAIGSENGSITADFTISGHGKESITSRSIESTSVRKDHHCSRCGHPGTIRSHVKLGCEKCLSEASSRCMDEQGCRPKGKDFKCTCEYCMRMESIKRNCKEEGWKLKICQKISATRGFPNKSIIEIFMSPESETLGDISRLSLTCKSPNLEALEEFLEMQLHWEKSYVRRKLLPLLSFYCLRETAAMRSSPNPFIRAPSINGIYVPHSIQRIKILFSKPLYRLRWAQSTATNSQDDWLDLYMPPNSYIANLDDGLDLMVSDLQTERIGNNLLFTTDEDMMLVKYAYPDIVLEFEKEQELLRSKKRTLPDYQRK
ncbi:hypothetical protein KP509_23G044300 [Ceratopteris richardii]|uniref:Flap endonuclease GEN-like 1 n=1 Tax=Ceratopteris richardii TaxID=49495 RepID=A0A8T2RZ55_CERRI|nr:hypothetical protein KP509_23G044300 [Ceratopteris richardii]